jgi:hypothetical protein
MKALEEVGKGVIALANLTGVLIFFKGFQQTFDLSLLFLGTTTIFILYFLGYHLIKISEG